MCFYSLGFWWSYPYTQHLVGIRIALEQFLKIQLEITCTLS